MTRFLPHVPRTNASHAPAVWAIDADHAPLYWFPRDCPRVTAWPRTPDEADVFRAAFHTTAPRLHGIELGWLERMRTAVLFAYELDAAGFRPWPAASGQWISTRTVEPRRVQPLHDLAVSDRWDFSIVRMANAQARPAGAGPNPMRHDDDRASRGGGSTWQR